MKRIIEFGHNLLKRNVRDSDITVDMTAGNGNDTLFLSQLSKQVYAFDIQNQAINNTKALLDEHKRDNVVLIKDSHENITKYIATRVGGVIFNLGFLPGSDKTITTTTNSTIKAIDASLTILRKDGICVIVCYPGHSEGKHESVAVLEYVSNLPQQQFKVLQYQFINQINNPPFVIAVQKLKEFDNDE